MAFRLFHHIHFIVLKGYKTLPLYSYIVLCFSYLLIDGAGWPLFYKILGTWPLLYFFVIILPLLLPGATQNHYSLLLLRLCNTWTRGFRSIRDKHTIQSDFIVYRRIITARPHPCVSSTSDWWNTRIDCCSVSWKLWEVSVWRWCFVCSWQVEGSSQRVDKDMDPSLIEECSEASPSPTSAAKYALLLGIFKEPL